MKKVFLVDDEILVRETIRDCIQWEKEGFLLCGDASDGEMALPLIEEQKPDIIITDIKMPFMDGLELCAILQKRMPQAKVIILSGHGEFEYAKAALQLGVVDYCLKPVSASDIVRLLHNVSAKIDKEREEQERMEKLALMETEQRALSKEKLLNDLCSGFITAAEAIRLSSQLSLPVTAKYYVVAAADMRCEAADGSASPLPPALLQEEDDTGDFFVFRRSRTETVWIFKGDSLENLQKVLQMFQALQSTPVPSQVTVGVGTIQDRLQGIHISFLEAQEDMHWRKLTKLNRSALWESTSGALDPSLFLDRARFIEFLKIGSPADADSFIRKFADGLRSVDWEASPIGYYILNDLTLELFRSAKDTYRSLDSLDETLASLQQLIVKVRSWNEACAYLNRLAAQYWQWRSGALDKYGDILIRVKEYIQLHYDKEHLSLQDAAEHVSLSPGHLSKVFSQETGQTFIEYVTQTRIRKAMELLHTTHAKSYEIAYQVGYNDAHYFSNLFKRVTGMTTKEFRKKGQTASSFQEPAAPEGKPLEAGNE
ncbi:response regulator [Paenibacillus turpanensis]|uniref:response regulator n=1 Tax=Paenibacillus turpanensis TaxID=2689078 RepID=UPI00140C1F20